MPDNYSLDGKNVSYVKQAFCKITIRLIIIRRKALQKYVRNYFTHSNVKEKNKLQVSLQTV